MSSKAVRKLYTISIETTASLKPIAVGILYYDNFILFYGVSCIDQFYDWLVSKCIHGTFYTHKLTLCGLALLNKADTRVKRDGIYKLGEIYQLRLSTENSNICLKCSFRLFPLSLLQIAELLHIMKDSQSDDVLNCNNLHLLRNSNKLLDKHETITCCRLKTIITRDLILKLDVQIKN